MKIVRLSFVCFALAVTCLSLTTEEIGSPRFESYPIAVWRGRGAPLDLRSHSLARLYKTRIREQIREEGVNFAGHYTLAAVGCGTGCSTTGIIDARTGRAYFPSELDGWTSIVGDYEIPDGEDQRMFRVNSRLLRAIGRPNLGEPKEERHGPSGIYYYQWKNNRLRLVKFTHVGSYPDSDPPVRH
ncbi:MAG TPA: hypothetical protein VGN90_11285 [Pyrinomonadaceae bacterium]|jgi:hypothetical protein|nr:hypothetical protein [Pyrinomonadaceae bacterium]